MGIVFSADLRIHLGQGKLERGPTFRVSRSVPRKLSAGRPEGIASLAVPQCPCDGGTGQPPCPLLGQVRCRAQTLVTLRHIRAHRPAKSAVRPLLPRWEAAQRIAEQHVSSPQAVAMGTAR